jgi:hypothetical protein
MVRLVLSKSPVPFTEIIPTTPSPVPPVPVELRRYVQLPVLCGLMHSAAVLSRAPQVPERE